MNIVGMWWLFHKETLRFLKVSVQTIVAPLIMSLLYLLVFGNVLEGVVKTYDSVSYAQFLIPGLIMMGIVGNSYANPSSSMIQSKVSGNIIFMLLAPLSYVEIFIAYLASAVLRGILVGFSVWLVSIFFIDLSLYSIMWTLVFALLSAVVLSIFGIISGILSNKYEHIAAFQNFVIMPLVFLSGVFYSIQSLPQIWQTVSKFNPMFYMIDGFRFGFIGQSDIDPIFSLLVLGAFNLCVAVLCLGMLKTSYKIRH